MVDVRLNEIEFSASHARILQLPQTLSGHKRKRPAWGTSVVDDTLTHLYEIKGCAIPTVASDGQRSVHGTSFSAPVTSGGGHAQTGDTDTRPRGPPVAPRNTRGRRNPQVSRYASRYLTRLRERARACVAYGHGQYGHDVVVLAVPQDPCDATIRVMTSKELVDVATNSGVAQHVRQYMQNTRSAEQDVSVHVETIDDDRDVVHTSTTRVDPFPVWAHPRDGAYGVSTTRRVRRPLPSSAPFNF